MATDKRVQQLINEMRRSGNLPALDRNVSALCALMGDRDTRMADLAAIIMRDAALTSNVLTVANSAAYRPKEPIKTISAAVILLGFEKVRALALGLAIFRQSCESARSRELYRLFTCAYISGTLAMSLARQAGTANPEEAFVSGLLHQLPRLLLANSFPEKYQEMEKLMLRENCSHNDACSRIFGMNYAEITHAIANYWNLPDSIRNTFQEHEGRPPSMIAMIHLAGAIADMLFGNVPAGEAPMQEAEQRMHVLLDVEDLKLSSFIQLACTSDANLSRFFNLNPKDIEMMVRIAEWGKVSSADITANLTVGYSLQEDGGGEDPRIMIGHFLSELMMSVQRHASVNDVLMIAQEAIYRCLNPACVFTSFLDRKTGEVVGRLYAGHSVLAKSRDFHFSMNDSRMLVVKALQAKRTMQAPMGGTEICPAINLLEDMELAQVCMTPILVGRQVVGGYFVGRSVDIPFSSEDIKWLDAIAGHVGMAIELSP